MPLTARREAQCQYHPLTIVTEKIFAGADAVFAHVVSNKQNFFFLEN